MSSKLVSTGIEFPDSSTQTTAATSGAADFSALTDATVSTTDPATDTNPSATGHHWINKTSGEYFVCTDNTTDENVWVNIGEGEDGVAPVTWYGGRGVFGGGYSGANENVIDYITIATTGNATDFGDLTASVRSLAACSDGSRGIFGGGEAAVVVNTIDYITIATVGNATDFGDLTLARYNLAACSDGTKGVFGGGKAADTDTIDYITIATIGNAVDFGNLTLARNGLAACSNGTRGVFGGGATALNTIDYITIASTGNATDFGDLTLGRYSIGSCSDATRGVFGGGTYYNGSTYITVNNIDYITISTTGNAVDFGDITVARYNLAACSDGTKGVFGGGSGYSNVMDYVTIQTTGNATDFGDLTLARGIGLASCSGD